MIVSIHLTLKERETNLYYADLHIRITIIFSLRKKKKKKKRRKGNFPPRLSQKVQDHKDDRSLLLFHMSMTQKRNCFVLEPFR
jgi:hypothetical protein